MRARAPDRRRGPSHAGAVGSPIHGDVPRTRSGRSVPVVDEAAEVVVRSHPRRPRRPAANSTISFDKCERWSVPDGREDDVSRDPTADQFSHCRDYRWPPVVPNGTRKRSCVGYGATGWQRVVAETRLSAFGSHRVEITKIRLLDTTEFAVSIGG